VIREEAETAKNTNLCPASGCDNDAKAETCPKCGEPKTGRSERPPSSDRINKDPIEGCLLKLCAVINGAWYDVMASIQSVSFLREAALYIDCTILSIWKRKKTGRDRRDR
jgi:hypothetical protein